MGDSKDNRPPPRLPGQGAAPGADRGTRMPSGTPGARPAGPAGVAARHQAVGPAPTATPAAAKEAARGRVVHDARGTAVWDWLKETGRIAIESTSRLLRKLEMPELKVEDKKDEELRLESDRDAGGGYDPYNQGKSSAPGRGRK